MQAATEKAARIPVDSCAEIRVTDSEAPVPKGALNGAGVSSFVENLYIEHHDLIFRTAFRITGSAMDAEDVLHTVFLRLLRKAPDLEFLAPPRADGRPQVTRAYLHRAAVNAALDVLRKRHRTTDLESLQSVLEDTQPGQENRQHSLELSDWLRSALGRLSPKAAEIFVLRFVEGYSNAEISRMLGASRSVVAVILFRIRGRLKKEIELFLGGTS
ncbi:MAG TPA: sigma-70 family RNA polymerase sigma factor [Acidobacteriota bacterium]